MSDALVVVMLLGCEAYAFGCWASSTHL